MKWETVIGLEVHAQLSTRSKLFSDSPTQYGASPNTQVNFIDAGLPGVLPVLNRQAVVMAIQFGLAIQAEINQDCYFERKNYFYPDLPKGYQISQFQRPIVGTGTLAITTPSGHQKIVQIQRAHLEEDAGKSLHERHAKWTGVDLNRAGTPLLEIVTTPCLYSAEEALAYLKALHQLVRFLGICDGNMQEGSFRCDVNLSLRPEGEKTLGTRTELKNINSFRFIEKAIIHEQLRHQERLENGQKIIQETRLYNPDTDQTEVIRSKEDAHDYRYFPDPDLLPISIDISEIEAAKQTMPALPSTLAREFKEIDQLSDEHIEFLLSSPSLVIYYQKIKQSTTATSKTILNWLKGPFAAALNELGCDVASPPISAERFATLLNRIDDRTLSNNVAKKAFTLLLSSSLDVDALIQAEGLGAQQSDVLLESIIGEIIQRYPEQAAELRAGKEKLMGFFVGQIMKACEGKADPAVVTRILMAQLRAV